MDYNNCLKYLFSPTVIDHTLIIGERIVLR